MTNPTRVAPSLAPGVSLLGEYQGSGFTEPHYLIVRADQQVLHVSRLLFVVASHIDGRSTSEEIAERVTQEYGRVLTHDGVELLVDTKLTPMGVVSSEAGTVDDFVRGHPAVTMPDQPADGEPRPQERPRERPQSPAARHTPSSPESGGGLGAALPTAQPLLALRFRGPSSQRR